jgi:predicted PurR-regulated permease PerM
MTKEQQLEISWKTIFKIGFAILFFYFLYLIRDVLTWVLFSFAFYILLDPPISLLSRKIPRWLSAILIYFLVFFSLIFLVYLFSLPLFGEVIRFIQTFPEKFQQYPSAYKNLIFSIFNSFFKSIQSKLYLASENLISTISAIFGGLFAAFTIISMAFLLSLEERGPEKVIFSLFGEKGINFLAVWEEAKEKISKWFGIRLITCFFVFFLTYIALSSLKTNYSISLSILAGILNFLPLIGPIISGILLFIICSLESLFKGILIVFLFLIIQLIEGNIFTPAIAQKIVDLPPFLILVSLLVGGKILGFWGAILAVPLFGVFFKFLPALFKE